MRLSKLLLLALTAFCVCFACAGNISAEETPGALWSPANVDWQVVKTKNKITHKDVCMIRWVYDKSIYLSFLEEKNSFVFNLQSRDEGGLPALVAGVDYYGVLIRRDGVITQISSSAINENLMSIAIKKEPGALQHFKTADKISIFFKDSIYDFPLLNAPENYGAYEKCVGGLNVEKEQEASSDAAVDVDAKATPLNELAVSNINSMSKDLAVPPHLPAFRLSKVRSSLLEKQKIVERNGDYKEVSENLLKKFRVLEKEKEELRRKLLTVTQDSFIPGLMACEPGAGGDDYDNLSSIIEDSYKASIQELRAENREMRAQLDSCDNSFEFDE